MNPRLGLVLGIALCFGCAKKSEQVTPTPAEVTSVAPQPTALSTIVAAAEPEPVVDPETLSVEEDFEQEAEKDLSSKNLVSKLDEIEKEIGQ